MAEADRAEFDRRMAGDIPAGGRRRDHGLQAEDGGRQAVVGDPQVEPGSARGRSTRLLPETIGGSADLTGSNNTKTKTHRAARAPAITAGRYIHYGIREHGMAAAMNGMALHGGVIPYGGTFLVFTDYCRAGDPPRRR